MMKIGTFSDPVMTIVISCVLVFCFVALNVHAGIKKYSTLSFFWHFYSELSQPMKSMENE